MEPQPVSGELIRCMTCGAADVIHDRVAGSSPSAIHVFACEECGEFWFERDGMPMGLRSLIEPSRPPESATG